MKKIYDKIFELLDKHLDAFVILGGDFKACMSVNEYLKRVKTKQESYLTKYIKADNSTCEVMEVYKLMEAE
jgi:hypothetical protein